MMMSDVSSVADWLSEIFSELGVGAKSVALLLTAILDSSLLSLPEINDALIFYFSALSPAHAFHEDGIGLQRGYDVIHNALFEVVGATRSVSALAHVGIVHGQSNMRHSARVS